MAGNASVAAAAECQGLLAHASVAILPPMPFNIASLKAFAPAMRRQLLEAVGRKLDLLLHRQTAETLATYVTQIADLREQEACRLRPAGHYAPGSGGTQRPGRSGPSPS